MRPERLYLQEMIEACSRILESVGDLDVGELEADPLRRDAALWNFTVLGEASNQLPGDFEAKHPEVPWSKPTQLRNRITHGYWAISVQVLIDTAQDVIPEFRRQIENVLGGSELRGSESQL